MNKRISCAARSASPFLGRMLALILLVSFIPKGKVYNALHCKPTPFFFFNRVRFTMLCIVNQPLIRESRALSNPGKKKE